MRIQDGLLRSLVKSDLDMVLEWRNADRIRHSMFTDDLISRDQHYAWFEALGQSNDIYLVFEWQHEPVGISNFKAIDQGNQTGFWGFYLGKTGLPRGMGVLLGYHSMEFAFGELGIRKLCSQVLVNNAVSLDFHKKMGFFEEGVLREHIKKEGKYLDVINMAQFNQGWKARKPIIIDAIENYYQTASKE